MALGYSFGEKIVEQLGIPLDEDHVGEGVYSREDVLDALVDGSSGWQRSLAAVCLSTLAGRVGFPLQGVRSLFPGHGVYSVSFSDRSLSFDMLPDGDYRVSVQRGAEYGHRMY
tara:strand:- start:81 stop:419 length:339 start_codon:yes stop_codon:yes gene_type:complete